MPYLYRSLETNLTNNRIFMCNMKKLFLMLFFVTVMTTVFSQAYIGMEKKSVVATIKANGGTYLNRAEGTNGYYNLSYQYPNNGLGFYAFDADNICTMTIESQMYNEESYQNLVDKLDENYEMLDDETVTIWIIPSNSDEEDIYYWVYPDEEKGILVVTTVKESDYEKYK
jgi:hypothetical protein